MSIKAETQYMHLETRPGSNYRQLFLKGRRIRAAVVDEAVHGPDPCTPEEFASDYQVPLEAVLEALDYAARNQTLIQLERDREAADIRARSRSGDVGMKFLIDENMSNRRLAARLQAQGHEPVLAGDVGLLSVTDAKVFTWAIIRGLPVLTRDYEDFADLHDLISSSGGSHGGLLVVRFDNDPRHNLTDRGIAAALGKLESANVPVADQIHILNHWR